MNASARLSNVPTAAPDGSGGRGRSTTAGFSDAFGDRHIVFDPATGSSVEALRFKPEFGNAPEFEAALRARVEQVGHLQHSSLATVQSVERTDEGLALLSKHVSGRRVSQLLPKAHGPAFALELIRLVTPALAAIQRTGEGVAHGALSADRVVVTRDGRLVVVEHVLGSAIESLKLSRARVNELGLVAADGHDPVVLDARTDMTQIGFIALELLLGRRLDPADYPGKLQAMFDEYVQGGSSPILSGKLRGWLERAMQLSVRSFMSARDAHDAFGDLPDEMDVRISESGRSLLEFPTEPTPAPMPIPVIRNDRVVEEHKPQPQTIQAIHDRKPQLVVTPPVTHEPPPAPIIQQAATGSRFGRIAPWVMGALVLVAGGEGVALFVLPSMRAATPVIEVKAPAVDPARTASAPLTPAPPASQTAAPASATPLPESTAKPAEAGLAAGASTAPAVVPSGPRFGAITVTSPIELHVFKDGQLVGSSAGSLALNEGSHTLEFVNETLGFRYRQTVNVRNGQMTSVKIAVPNGRISINAVPWAEVLIDGTPAGETPLANLSLPIGTHEIVFRHPQLGERKQTVVVKADGLLKLTQAMESK